jgi:hypothetical protein
VARVHFGGTWDCCESTKPYFIEQLTAIHPVKKFHIYDTQGFITTFTKATTGPYPKPQTFTHYFSKIHFNIILPSMKRFASERKKKELCGQVIKTPVSHSEHPRLKSWPKHQLS